MLKYFYTGEYCEPRNEDEELLLQLQVQVQTYNLADKYDVLALMGLASTRFKSTLSRVKKLEEYLSMVLYVYTTHIPTNALRVITVEYARTKFRNLMQTTELGTLRATLQDIPEFAFDVIQQFVNAPLRGNCSHCGPKKSPETTQARCAKCGKLGITIIH